MNQKEAALFLEAGHLFIGEGFGAEVPGGGEAVFNTSMGGYQEVLTDPSYHQQLVVMTYPHIGNTGINSQDVESKRLFIAGLVVRAYSQKPSSWRSESPLDACLKASGVPAITGVDTRRITQVLRDKGAQRGVIFPSRGLPKADLLRLGKEKLSVVPSMEGLELVSRVSCTAPYEFGEAAGMHRRDRVVVVYDFGAKHNILRNLKERGFRVWVVPYNMPYQEVLSYKPVAVVLSNGPGDPACVHGAVEEIQALMGRVPILAICMGHQLLARALGCSTYKLKFGHHGVNHPVQEVSSGRVFITSHNHGFAVRGTDLQRRGLTLSHVSLNDQTVEGFYSEKLRFYSVQFHPEARPGPNEAAYLFDQFVKGFLQ